jgi:predicted Zn-dependent protease
VALCLAILVSLPAGCSGTHVSRSQEIRLGQQASAEIDRQYWTSEDPTVSRTGEQIAAVSDEPDLPYRFRVIDMKGVNAFSLPGGPVYVTADLLQMVDGDRDELAGVLGHEVSHITLHHAAKQIERQQWLGLGIDVLVHGGSAATLASLAANLQLLHYSRKQEYAADKKGIQYAAEAGYDPMGLVRFLDRLASMEQGGQSIPWLRTHPGTRARAERLRKLIKGSQR